MTPSEFIDEFDILFEDLATNGSKGLDDYEKSVCYTYAQEEMVRMFADSGQEDELSEIIAFQNDLPIGVGNYQNSLTFPYLDSVKILDRIINNASANEDIFVIQVQPDTIASMYRAPYKYPPKNLAYVVVGDSLDEVFPPLNYGTVSYTRRYVAYPSPVILVDLTTLPGGVTINGLTAITPPILHEEQHRRLLTLAVQFAVKTYIGVEESDAPDSNQGS